MEEILVPVMVVLGTLALGLYGVAVIDGAMGSKLAGQKGSNAFFTPLYRTASLWLAPANTTGKADSPLWRLPPALYLIVAATGLAMLPWSASFAPVNLQHGVALWCAVEASATLLILLHGWAANSHFPLLGGYRYMALGLSYVLVSVFVLIAVALPADSLQFGAVVESQQGLWNLVRQPLGLPLLLIVGLGISFWGPLNFADATDLAGGTSAEISGRARLLWQGGRAAMLVAFSGIAATAFLGGYLGPVLPAPAWLVLKMLAILALMLLLGRLLPRISPDRFITLAWLVLLPLAFINLAWAAVQAW